MTQKRSDMTSKQSQETASQPRCGSMEVELDLVPSSQEEHVPVGSPLEFAIPFEPEPEIIAMSLMEEQEDTPGAFYDPAIPSPTLFALVGREEDLARIKQRLQNRGNAGLTVLNGLPGVGKTALSIALAYDLDIRASFSDGVLWAGLGPDPNIIGHLSRWGTLVGLSTTQMTTLRGNEAWACAIRDAIGTRKMLLVIDDAWQFEEAQTLRVGGPNCVHLVTTRFPAIATQITATGAITIQELNSEHSMHLLNRLVPQVVSYETQKVQDLVQAVGGLPLALTLLGNYLRRHAYQNPARRITAALERLSDAQVRLQINEPQNSIASHPSLPVETALSLQSVIAVTDQLLPNSARIAFYMLSVFPSKPRTFSEEAALAVTDCTLEVLDTLSDAGLLESHGNRYTLHQVIADYAHIHLDDLRACQVSDQLITYVSDYVETHKKDYALLEQESSIIRAALEMPLGQEKQHELIRTVCAFAPFLILRGFYHQAEHHLKRAYEAAQALHDAYGITGTLLYLGEIEQHQSNYAQAETYLQQGLSLARQIHNDERISALLTQLGIVLQHQGNFQQAETTYQEGLTLARNITNDERICTLLNNLGWLTMKRGEFAQAEIYLQEGLSIAHQINDRERICGLFRMLGTLAGNRGDFVQAQTYFQEGLLLARQLRDREQTCVYLISLGTAAARQGKNIQAKMYFQESLELARQISHREYICIILINLGDVFVEENNYIQAENYFQEGLTLARQIGHREWISSLLMNLGMTTRKQGHYDMARCYLEESFDLAHQLEKPDIICIVMYELGNISLSEGKTNIANNYFIKMREMVPVGNQELLALASYGIAQVLVLYGQMTIAKEYAEESVTTFETMRHRNVDEVRGWMRATF